MFFNTIQTVGGWLKSVNKNDALKIGSQLKK